MEPQRIGDIPKIQDVLTQLRAFQALKPARPLLKMLATLLGDQLDNVDTIFDQLDQIEAQATELVHLPDTFNDLFVAQGWICYDFLNIPVAKEAIHYAQQGDIGRAEQILAAWYTPEMLRISLARLHSLKAFRPRMDLARKAVEDYAQKRYYASVLVILSLTDGLVNDVHPDRRGLFAHDADVTAWNTLAGHSKGLKALADVLNKGRRKTHTEAITIPYRHGIMHGMDMGYDNHLVAAKTWALLFAVAEWAWAVESGTDKAPPPKEPRLFVSQIQHGINEFKRYQEQKTHSEIVRGNLEQWKLRDLQIGIDIPATGAASDYELNTPERTLVEFFEYWKQQKFGTLIAYLPSKQHTQHGASLPRRLRDRLGYTHLETFQL